MRSYSCVNAHCNSYVITYERSTPDTLSFLFHSHNPEKAASFASSRRRLLQSTVDRDVSFGGGESQRRLAARFAVERRRSFFACALFERVASVALLPLVLACLLACLHTYLLTYMLLRAATTLQCSAVYILPSCILYDVVRVRRVGPFVT